MIQLCRRGFNVIISAPSGVGKSSLIKQLIKDDPQLVFSVSATTRSKRLSEINEVDYHFKTTEEFYSLIESNSFLEYAEVFNNMYGTLTEEVNKNVSSGKDTIFDIDWKGAFSLKSKMSDDTISIFIIPPSFKELERRIRSRNQDNEETILYRMAKSRSELSNYAVYDYIVVNDDFKKALEEIKSIISANRLRKEKFINLEQTLQSL